MYKDFARVYDELMYDAPYDNWYQLIIDIYNKYHLKGNSILDIACGTGELTSKLAADYELTGIDLSEDMLEIAQIKSYEAGSKIRYINQDIRELELFKKYDSIISFCDGFNYMLTDEDLEKAFQSVDKYLKEDGLFLLEISSDYKLQHIIGNSVFADASDDVSYIWENEYKEPILSFDLSIFIKYGNIYKRYDERHKQRAFKVEEIENKFKVHHIELLEIIDTMSNSRIHKESERWLFVGRKHG